MPLTKEQILAAQDIKTETVPVPEWGGEVLVRAMSGADRDAYEQSLISARGDDEKANIANIRARLVSFSVVDDAGNRVFTEADIEQLGKKSVVALDRVIAVARRLSVVTREDVVQLGKPSAPTGADSSTFASPAS